MKRPLISELSLRLIELWADPTVKVGVTFAVITAVMIGSLGIWLQPGSVS